MLHAVRFTAAYFYFGMFHYYNGQQLVTGGKPLILNPI